MPSGDKQHPVAVTNVTLRELSNTSDNIMAKPAESSPFTKERLPMIDSEKACGNKRQQPDRSSSPSSHQPHVSRGVNGHLVYVRRKLETDRGRKNLLNSADSINSSIFSRKYDDKETRETKLIQDKTQESNGISHPSDKTINGLQPADSAATSKTHALVDLGTPNNQDCNAPVEPQRPSNKDSNSPADAQKPNSQPVDHQRLLNPDLNVRLDLKRPNEQDCEIPVDPKKPKHQDCKIPVDPQRPNNHDCMATVDPKRPSNQDQKPNSQPVDHQRPLNPDLNVRLDLKRPNDQDCEIPVDPKKPNHQDCKIPVDPQRPNNQDCMATVDPKRPSNQDWNAPAYPERPSDQDHEPPVDHERWNDKYFYGPIDPQKPGDKKCQAPVDPQRPSNQHLTGPLDLQRQRNQSYRVPVDPQRPNNRDSGAPAEPQRQQPINQDWKERYRQLQVFLKNCDQSNQEDYKRMLRSLTAAGRSRLAADLERRALNLLVQEAEELRRMQALNVVVGEARLQDHASPSTQTSTAQSQFQRMETMHNPNVSFL